MTLFHSPPPLLFFSFFLLGCTHPQPSPPQTQLPASLPSAPSAYAVAAQHPTDKISNLDIQWDGNYFGLWPTITGPSKDFLTNSDPKIVPALIKSLTDNHRYIAAHVLLTHLAHEQFELTASHWNGLRVELLADNSILIPPGQQPSLTKKWTHWHATKQKTE